MASQSERGAEEPKLEENEDTVLSMVEVLQESEDLEEEATAVLGDSDDRCCTYPLGYRERQALYACTTCTPAGDGQPAGVCLACSYECHEGHQMYELYTKRNFRCDCGNSKFGSMTCKLIANKADTNPDNKYNQNFRGVYCICSRPYPDPEDEIEDEMIQCVVCEDWFHGRHLGGVSVPDSNDFQEMVCGRCMEGSCHFLWYYNITSKEVKLETEDSSAVVEVEEDLKTEPQQEISQEDQKKNPVSSDAKPVAINTASNGSESNILPDNSSNVNSSTSAVAEALPTTTEQTIKTQASTSSETSPQEKLSTTHAGTSGEESKAQLNGRSDAEDKSVDSCKLNELKRREIVKKGHATFWPSGWRSKLCTCLECKKLYEREQISFLLDEFDTVSAYEERGKVKHAGSSQYQRGMDALTTLNRVQQVEVLHGYNDLKTSLNDYLQSFASEGKVVKRQDIDDFFSDMQSRKKQRVGDSGIQHFCR
ncbi:putative E3 ubiquitin-protein ligase UBR7 [Asterias rubens]|uniref:putative E3 ubiquitin-protein ligase UBR7 n=1 Tax=Asterias rubens TaxID=7604 RepID=UPI001455B08B|nr:putative E3 ubiquitin-protein ligase UBR7 [Asterias rubens]